MFHEIGRVNGYSILRLAHHVRSGHILKSKSEPHRKQTQREKKIRIYSTCKTNLKQLRRNDFFKKFRRPAKTGQNSLFGGTDENLANFRYTQQTLLITDAMTREPLPHSNPISHTLYYIQSRTKCSPTTFYLCGKFRQLSSS